MSSREFCASDSALAVIIMAAGQGTRMKSPLPKVLHTLDGAPMVHWVLNACEGVGAEKIIAVVGHESAQVEQAIGTRATCVPQLQQLGTAHAVLQAQEILRDWCGEVLVVSGDTPLITAGTLDRLVSHHRRHAAAATLLTALLEDAASYGRILRQSDGSLKGIVEFKEATAEQIALREINAGCYCFNCRLLFDLLPLVSNDNNKKEYYLTDVIELLAVRGHRMEALVTEDFEEAMGVNTPEELQHAEQILTGRQGQR